MEEGRVFIREGPLMMVKGKKKGKENSKEIKLTTYQCFLFNDMIIYACKDTITSKVTAASKAIMRDIYIAIFNDFIRLLH
jgi:hypothetical protein